MWVIKAEKQTEKNKLKKKTVMVNYDGKLNARYETSTNLNTKREEMS